MQHRIRAAGLLVEDNRVLMLNVEDGTGQYWILPGGGLEKGDNSTKEALRREFLEEAGLEVQVGELMCVREFLEPQCERYHAEFFYEIISYQGETTLDNLHGLNDEAYIKAVEWIDIKALSGLRLYPEQLKNVLITQLKNRQMSIHLGSYVQGENEQINRL